MATSDKPRGSLSDEERRRITEEEELRASVRKKSPEARLARGCALLILACVGFAILAFLLFVLFVFSTACGQAAAPAALPDPEAAEAPSGVEQAPTPTAATVTAVEEPERPSATLVPETVTPAPSATPLATPPPLIPTPTQTPTATLVPPTSTPTPDALQAAEVVRIIDGDTIEVEIDGLLYTVRYIGVDTPETQHPTKGEEPYGREATEINRLLVEGQTVQLEKDVSETDRFGRLLRYVWVGDMMINAVLVAEGYARVSTFPPDVAYTDGFLALEREARKEGLGLWGALPEAPLDPFEEDMVVSEDCDSAYPTVCIPSPPPDLNCGDVSYRRFEVLAPDPHRFDGDKDGVGCES